MGIDVRAEIALGDDASMRCLPEDIAR